MGLTHSSLDMKEHRNNTKCLVTSYGIVRPPICCVFLFVLNWMGYLSSHGKLHCLFNDNRHVCR